MQEYRQEQKPRHNQSWTANLLLQLTDNKYSLRFIPQQNKHVTWETCKCSLWHYTGSMLRWHVFPTRKQQLKRPKISLPALCKVSLNLSLPFAAHSLCQNGFCYPVSPQLASFLYNKEDVLFHEHISERLKRRNKKVRYITWAQFVPCQTFSPAL